MQYRRTAGRTTSSLDVRTSDPASPKVWVLIVDDAPGCRRVMCELLERRGYAIAGEVDRASLAIDHVERLAPDAVLLDVHLPDANVLELAASLTRAHPALAVVLTSRLSEQRAWAAALSSDSGDGSLPVGATIGGEQSKGRTTW